VPTTFAQLEDELRVSLGLTPQEARSLIIRLVPTLEIARVADTSGATGGVNAALGRAFPSAVGGQYSIGQLLNPVGSGTILLVSFLGIAMDITSWGVVVKNSTALATLLTDVTWADFRRTGNPVGQIREENNVTFPPGDQIFETRLGSDSGWNWLFPHPIVLAPGDGLVMAPGTVAQTVAFSFFWTEEAA